MKPKVKYLAIYKNKDKYPISMMCKFFEVSRSGYYAYLKTMNQPDKDEYLHTLIKHCQEQCHKTYGYRRVQIWLEREHHGRFNHKAILRVMNRYNLLAEIRRRKKYTYYGEQLHRYSNLLNRNFEAEKKNQKWVTDISYIHTGEGILYLSMIRDLFDRSIVAYKTGTEQTSTLVIDTIKIAKEKETATKEVQLHSDQGSQYTTQEYFNLTKEYDITPSMSRRGNCYDNACAENFFSILKTECIYRAKPRTIREAKGLIDNYIHFYNYERIQSKTKLTPYEKRCQSA